MLIAIMTGVPMFVILMVYKIVSGRPVDSNLLLMFMVNLPFCIIFGLVDWWIIDSIHRMRRLHSNAARIVAGLLLTSLVWSAGTVLINSLMDGGANMAGQLKNSLASVPLNWIIASQIELYLYQQRQTATERQLETIEKERALFQFEMLKNQINPHFLFNSLNILASLAWQDADKTNRFTKKLSSVYRYLLTTRERQTVTLQEELQFLDSYLYLENIRFGDTLHVNIVTTAGADCRMVIPASIQMLVENALKHNINTRRSPLVIDITTDNDGITVSNNLQPRAHTVTNGMGLANLQRQYMLHGKHIKITRDEEKFTVMMPFIGA